MLDGLVQLAEDAITSPWAYVALFSIAAIDAFFPAVPSESLVITAGVFAASGEPALAAVIAVSALGAFAGDHISYLIGRKAGRRVLGRIGRHRRGRTAVTWATEQLTARGGVILLVARYIPGGRTATTLTMGAVAYRLRLFSGFDALAALSWATYSALLGFLGGTAFEQDPAKGLLFGLGLALLVTVVVEAVRFVRNRRRAADERAVADRA